ncbi:MAG TPA: hypothetical protein PKN59_00380 [Syntrophales bacterium]|nr:hypothetical protein [Syntrophales bacterium]
MTDNTQESPERCFDNVDEVIEYLAACGWVARKSTVYRHRKEGKFFPKENGQFRQKDVDRYARTWLKRQSTGRKVKDRLDELQEKKLLEEYEEQKEKTRKIKRQNDVEEGKLIDRADVEKWLAGRAGILEAGLKHWIQSRAADWVRMTGGDLKGVGELINAMIRDLDEHINGYAAAKEFDLVIEGEEEEGPLAQTEEQ